MLAQQKPQCLVSGTGGFSHGRKKLHGFVNRTLAAGAINLPTPWLGWICSVLHNDRKIIVLPHGNFHPKARSEAGPGLTKLADFLCLQRIRLAHVARNEPFALRFLARELARAADCLGFFSGFAF